MRRVQIAFHLDFHYLFICSRLVLSSLTQSTPSTAQLTSHNMPPKSTSSQGPKQTSLLGFFSKPATPAVNRSRIPATTTPATAVGSSAAKRTPASTTSDAAEKRRQVIRAAAAGSPTGGIRANGESSTGGKDLADGSAEGKKEAGKVDSDVFLGSSPLSAVDVLDDDETTAVEVKDDKANATARKTDDGDVDMVEEQEEDEDDQPVRSSVSRFRVWIGGVLMTGSR